MRTMARLLMLALPSILINSEVFFFHVDSE